MVDIQRVRGGRKLICNDRKNQGWKFAFSLNSRLRITQIFTDVLVGPMSSPREPCGRKFFESYPPSHCGDIPDTVSVENDLNFNILLHISHSYGET